MSKVEIPKIAAKFVEDAKAAGFKVEVTHDEVSYSVFAENAHGWNVSVVWSKCVVYDSPLSGERLGFRTHGGREAVRFDHGTVKNHSGYHAVTSVRQARGHIGLEI